MLPGTEDVDNGFDLGETDDHEDEDSLAMEVQDLGIHDAPGTVVMFNESGCIPSCELLGLTRLDSIIDAIVVVGDKHQLPLHDPASNTRKTPKKDSRLFSSSFFRGESSVACWTQAKSRP